MPRTEARIFTSIWRDEHFLALPGSAQRLYIFLLSQDDLAYCGVIPLRVPRWAKKAAGLTAADLEHDLKVLEGTAYPSAYPTPNPDPDCENTPFVIIDRDTGELFVRALVRRDGIWKQPNLMKQARDTAEQIESLYIRGALLTELRRLPLDETGSALVRRVIEEFVEDLEKGGPYPSAYPTDYPSPNPSDDSTGMPSDDPSQGIGEGNGSSRGDPLSPIPRSPMSAPRHPKTGTRLPDDFEEQIRARPDLADWFRENCPHVDGKREMARFRDHWVSKPGKDGRKVDWVATWRNWMRTAEDRAGPRGGPGGGRPARRGGASDPLTSEAYTEGGTLL